MIHFHPLWLTQWRHNVYKECSLCALSIMKCECSLEPGEIHSDVRWKYQQTLVYWSAGCHLQRQWKKIASLRGVSEFALYKHCILISSFDYLDCESLLIRLNVVDLCKEQVISASDYTQESCTSIERSAQLHNDLKKAFWRTENLVLPAGSISLTQVTNAWK